MRGIGTFKQCSVKPLRHIANTQGPSCHAVGTVGALWLWYHDQPCGVARFAMQGRPNHYFCNALSFLGTDGFIGATAINAI